MVAGTAPREAAAPKPHRNRTATRQRGVHLLQRVSESAAGKKEGWGGGGAVSRLPMSPHHAFHAQRCFQGETAKTQNIIYKQLTRSHC